MTDNEYYSDPNAWPCYKVESKPLTEFETFDFNNKEFWDILGKYGDDLISLERLKISYFNYCKDGKVKSFEEYL